MLIPRCRRSFALFLFALFLPIAPAAHAERGVVWLAARSDGKKSEASIRIPLEWLANADRKEHSRIKLDDETIDCTALWLEHRDLPVGESREIRRGTTEDGDRYVAQVVSEKPLSRRALGKVHILATDPQGAETDVRFPLDLGGLLRRLGDFIVSFFGGDPGDRSTQSAEEANVGQLGDLKKLADYGPFVFLQAREKDGSKVRISIE